MHFKKFSGFQYMKEVSKDTQINRGGSENAVSTTNCLYSSTANYTNVTIPNRSVCH